MNTTCIYPTRAVPIVLIKVLSKGGNWVVVSAVYEQNSGQRLVHNDAPCEEGTALVDILYVRSAIIQIQLEVAGDNGH